MGLLTWVLVGFVAGVLAKWIFPGKQGGGLIKTTLLGVIGALIGGFLATQLGFGDVSGFNLESLGIAVAGALVVLWGYGMLPGRR